MEQTERQAIIIWLYTLKQLKQLRKFGNVTYISKKMKYVYLYVDQADAKDIMAKLDRLHFVRSVELSHRPSVRMDFTKILPELREEYALAKSKQKQEQAIALNNQEVSEIVKED